MTAFWVLIAGAAVAAVVDWWALHRIDHRLEYAAKPTVLAALVLAAAVLPVTHTALVDRRWWFVGALVCCLLGDIALMLPRDHFVAGLAAFLAGHVLFIVGFLQPPSPPGVPPFAFSTEGLLVAALCVVTVEAAPTTLVFSSLRRRGEHALAAPVTVYIGAIATMVVLATNVGDRAAAVGAVLFLLSDTLLAWNRFIAPVPAGPLPVHVTYHLAQILLVLSLVH